MWTTGQTEQLTASAPEGKSWIGPQLLEECDRVARELRITGTQTYDTRFPADEDVDYLAFSVELHSTLASNVKGGFVLASDTPYISRVTTISEAIADLTHGAAFGDKEMDSTLRTLVGDTWRDHLVDVELSTHP